MLYLEILAALLMLPVVVYIAVRMGFLAYYNSKSDFIQRMKNRYNTNKTK